MLLRLPRSTLFPYTTLFRSATEYQVPWEHQQGSVSMGGSLSRRPNAGFDRGGPPSERSCHSTGEPQSSQSHRSEEHTSELQSHSDLVCRLPLEKKNCKIRGL